MNQAIASESTAMRTMEPTAGARIGRNSGANAARPVVQTEVPGSSSIQPKILRSFGYVVAAVIISAIKYRRDSKYLRPRTRVRSSEGLVNSLAPL